MKKIIVNPDKCIRCGACVGICEDVFQFSEEGHAETKENENIVENMSEEVKEDAMDALEGCPTGAIEEVEVEES